MQNDASFNERDDRSKRAWSHDSTIINEYNNKLRKLESKNLKNKSFETEKEKIRIKYEAKLEKIGLQRQRMFYDSNVMVVGSGALAQMVSGALAGLSVGNIYLMDDSRVGRKDINDFLCLKENKGIPSVGKEKTAEIEKTLKKINRLSDYISIFSPFSESLIYRTLKPQTLIDATNDSISKKSTLKYAMQYNIPLFSVFLSCNSCDYS